MLQSDDLLATSPVVANCRMNRERRATGSNGYAADLKFDPIVFLRERLERNGRARWLDLCCGAGLALYETATTLSTHPHFERLEIIGIDLVDAFASPARDMSGIRCEARSWTEGPFPADCDLVTCVHGLHYLGDKLACLAKAASALALDGWLAVNLDPVNIRLGDPARSTRTLLRMFREFGWDYHSRTHVLIRRGRQDRAFPVHYLGADDTVGPNYSGQPAVTSHYVERHSSAS